MAEAMRKMAVFLGLAEDYHDRDHDEFDDDGNPRWRDDADDDEDGTGHEGAMADQARITALHPQTYNEALFVGEYFRQGIPVIMDLTEMADADAKRLVDFAAGLIFGRRGDIERVASKVFLLTPPGVTVITGGRADGSKGGDKQQRW
jgi:cell division inhibitor SepF